MKLYEVTNGFMGYSYVRILIIAENKDEARQLAGEQYRNEAKKTNMRGRDMYKESYYTDLEVELLCDDTTKKWAGYISD